jgi:signal transduction histidine kinase
MTSMVLTSTVVLLLAGGVLMVGDAVSVRRALVQTLTTRAQILAANSTAALAFRNPEDAAQVLDALGTDPNMVAGALYDEHGRLFATFPRSAQSPLVPSSAPGHGHRFEKDCLVLYQPVLQEGRILGTLYLRCGLRELSDRLRLSLLMVALAIGGAIAVAFVLAAWLQRGLTTPVRTLAEIARNVSEQQDYRLRAPVTSDDELGLLTESFNEMLRLIEQRDGQIRQMNAQLERRVASRTAELEASNRELEAFSYSVSHDLRAPLRHVDGYADLLKRQSADTLDEKGKRYLATISESAKSMGMLIDDLLSFSRMGRSEMRTTTVSLASLVAEVRQEVERDAADREIAWVVAPLPEVQADPALLRQVVTNLPSNAVKYTRQREVARIEIGAVESGTETTVFVRDNGVGFDPAYSHKLFGVFQRLHSAEEFEGTGIGLANVHRIIQRHGGKTWAEGQVGQGATFYFSLPRGESAHGHREAA